MQTTLDVAQRIRISSRLVLLVQKISVFTCAFAGVWPSCSTCCSTCRSPHTRARHPCPFPGFQPHSANIPPHCCRPLTASWGAAVALTESQSSEPRRASLRPSRPRTEAGSCRSRMTGGQGVGTKLTTSSTSSIRWTTFEGGERPVNGPVTCALVAVMTSSAVTGNCSALARGLWRSLQPVLRLPQKATSVKQAELVVRGDSWDRTPAGCVLLAACLPCSGWFPRAGWVGLRWFVRSCRRGDVASTSCSPRRTCVSPARI